MLEQAQLVPKYSLLTKTPEEGRQLAIKMTKLTILLDQQDEEVREKVNALYSKDPAMLIAIGQTIAIEFNTIAKANNYWIKF